MRTKLQIPQIAMDAKQTPIQAKTIVEEKSLGLECEESPINVSSDSLKRCRRSILQNPVSGHWCFNCRHYVETDDIFISKKYKDYMYDFFQTTEAPKPDFLVCICLDCIYYRLNICCSCMEGKPLCMYPLEQWFEHKPTDRRCIDCTAIEETQDILRSLNHISPSQCILQCHGCSKFKCVCCFSVFGSAYGDKARRVIKDLNSKRDKKLYKRSVCLECRLSEDINQYRKCLRERYNSKISSEPTPDGNNNDDEPNITSNDLVSKKFFGGMSYAKAVAGLPLIPKPYKVGAKELQQALTEDSGDGPAYFLSTMKDFIAEMLLTILESGLTTLQEKTGLEVKLSELPENMWYTILQKKMQFTTHMFSMQASGLGNFVDPESRWVYTSLYTPVHASMVYDTILKGKFTSLVALLKGIHSNGDENFNVSCFGAGPGSEVLGLDPFMPKNVHYSLFDNCPFWEHNAKSLLHQGLGLQVSFNNFDVQRKLRQDVLANIKKANLITMIKFLSAVSNQSDAVFCLRAMFQAAAPGTQFLIIDNAQPQIKNYVESLLFPNRNFTETNQCKESNDFRMFMSYAEYRYDVAEVMESHQEICKLMSMVMEWVERPPLVDVRVYIFLVEKK